MVTPSCCGLFWVRISRCKLNSRLVEQKNELFSIDELNRSTTLQTTPNADATSAELAGWGENFTSFMAQPSWSPLALSSSVIGRGFLACYGTPRTSCTDRSPTTELLGLWQRQPMSHCLLLGRASLQCKLLLAPLIYIIIIIY